MAAADKNTLTYEEWKKKMEDYAKQRLDSAGIESMPSIEWLVGDDGTCREAYDDGTDFDEYVDENLDAL